MSELLTPRTPGAALRAAREKRRLSIAEVGEATRIKVHMLKALENDDYSVMAAPLYGKGFIKMYAEYVGLDPAPLIRHYLSNYARTVRPTLKTELTPPSPVTDGLPKTPPLARFRESSGSAWNQVVNNFTTGIRDILHTLAVAWIRLKAAMAAVPAPSMMSSSRGYSESEPIPVGRYAALVFAVLVVAILVISAIYMIPSSKTPPSSSLAVTGAAPAKRVTVTHQLRLAEPPPAPYAKLK
ncbi:MAG: helix-turn-helix transcriptional regulator [bacterium]